MKQNRDCSDTIRIANRSDALEVFDKLLLSIAANGDISGYVETTCGEGPAFNFLCALQEALEKGTI